MSGPGDVALLAWLAAAQQPWLDGPMAGVTWFGSLWFLLPLLLLIALRWRRVAMLSLLALVSASAVCHLLKVLIGRPRPELWPGLSALPPDAAFPSAHATQAMAVAVALCCLLPASMRPVVGGVLIVLAALVGVSRLYLQVHWPSDVVAGWLLGAGVALLVVCLAPRPVAGGGVQPSS